MILTPLLQVAEAVAATEETLTGLSHTAEKLTLAGVLVLGNIVQALVVRFFARRYFKLIDEQRAEYKARSDADAAALRAVQGVRHGSDKPIP